MYRESTPTAQNTGQKVAEKLTTHLEHSEWDTTTENVL